MFASPALAAGRQEPTRAAKEPVSLFAWFWQAYGDLLPSGTKSSGPWTLVLVGPLHADGDAQRRSFCSFISDCVRIGKERVADLQAAAWANLGTVKRLASDFEGSRRAFNEAWRILEQGTGDPLEAAGLLSLEAGCMRDMGELETAEAALEKAYLVLCERMVRLLRGGIWKGL